MSRPMLYGGITLLAVVLVFQLFLRYDYTQDRRYGLVRIDRVTGSMCTMPCTPPPPTPTRTPYDALENLQRFAERYDVLKQQAIRLAKAAPQAASIVEYHPDYQWSAYNGVNDFAQKLFLNTPAPNASPFVPNAEITPTPVLLVCYCDKKGTGFRWEVHVDSGDVFYANDNADLSKEYGLGPSK